LPLLKRVLFVPILTKTKAVCAITKGFLKAASRHMNWFLKAASRHMNILTYVHFCDFQKSVHIATGGFQNPIVMLLAAF
jgi:hypothetical protein